MALEHSSVLQRILTVEEVKLHGGELRGFPALLVHWLPSLNTS